MVRNYAETFFQISLIFKLLKTSTNQTLYLFCLAQDEEIPRPKSKKPRKTPALIDEDD